ncbi:MAG: hypothetical protein ACI9IO_000656 [Cyanobium sp.]
MTDSAQQKPAPPNSPANSPANSPTDSATESPADSLHDFDVQKELHQKIRNDPDYDDWEYGTEPLPHEAWVASQAPKPEPPAAV